MSASARYALGIDVGGTHTDIELVAIGGGESYRHKIASTPDDPARAVTEGTREILALSRIAPEQIVYFAHGTTVATNALVQGRTASTALVTTRGFRDVLEIRRQRQPHLYNLRVEKPAPPVPRHLRYEIGERHYLFGRDDVEPDPHEIESLAAALAAAGVEAVAVCFLHSYDDPAHERSVGAQLRQALPGVFVCLSSDVVPEPHEYERTSTTAINACLGPVMSGYLARITTGARGNGLVVEPTILQSNGGVASADDAAMLPARALASGPAAGVMGALGVADAVGLDDVITFDVGGTTADVCLVERGTPLVASEREVAGYPVRFPMIDVHSVGAGGGSIAWIDSGGFMHVGPRSAGAAPGPAAYGRGGELPTVTDACLVLGHLSRNGLLAGRLPLDIDAARRAIETRIAEPLSMSVEDAAVGMLTLLNENMVQAVRVISVERGFDPRCFALVAFGGAGPLLAGALARELAIETVLIPPCPGLLCAQGLLVADERTDFARTRIMILDASRAAEFDAILTGLEAQATAWFDAGRIPREDRRLTFTADLRYDGQSHQLRVGVERARGASSIRAVLDAFHAEHRREYGFEADAPVEAVTFRVTASAATHRIDVSRSVADAASGRGATVRSVRFIGATDAVECPVVPRATLRPGTIAHGPLIVEQMDATTVVAPGERLEIDGSGVMVLRVAPTG